jgi:hypothetical protein
MIAEGTYRARAVDAEFGNSSQKGTPFVRVRFEVQGPEGAEVLPFTGWFTDTVGKDGRTPTDRAIEQLKIAGCTFPSDEITNTAGLGDTEVSVSVKHEQWEDKDGKVHTSAVVAFVNAVGQGGKVRDEDKMDASKKTAFARSMKGHLVASRGKRQAAAPKAAPKNGKKPTAEPNPIDGGNDEEIPF